MSGSVGTFLKAQDASVLASFIDDDWCICAAINAPALEELARKRGRTVESLPDLERSEAMVVRHGGHAELWVRARRSGYASVFLTFARRLGGATFSAIPSGYHVDHLFSRGRVRTAGSAEDPEDNRLPYPTLVRMLLVDAGVNQSFGGLMEGDMIGSGNAARFVRRFTWLQLVKALSIDANSGGGGFGGDNMASNMAHAAAELDARGVCKAMGMGREQVMRELMQGARTVLHYRNV